MKKILILEIGGEGGSIKLLKINDEFVYTTSEFALMEEGDDPKDFKSRSSFFQDFDSAMVSMINKYPVFRLYPLEINDKFKDQINKYYQTYLTSNKGDNYLRNEKWESILLSL